MNHPLQPEELLRQATCAVLWHGEVSGTAWLASSKGHLLTAGHILGKEQPCDQIEVCFAEDVPRTAYRIQWGYQHYMGIDFAVLQLQSPPDHRVPLPLSLARTVPGSFRSCGYGKTLVHLSSGRGEFLGAYDWQNSSSNRLFKLDSKQMGEGGYSGAAIFSDNLGAVVALQISATDAFSGPERDTVLAMPLYRIAYSWEYLNQLAQSAPSPPPSSPVSPAAPPQQQPASSGSPPSSREVRAFFMEKFDAQSLDTFCYDYYSPVYDQFSQGMLKGQKIQQLIEYCERRGLLAELYQRASSFFQSGHPAPPPATAPPSTVASFAAMPEVFLCYAEQDRAQVESYYQWLAEAGMKPWMESRDILPGEQRRYAIKRAIERSDFLLVFLSEQAVTQPGSFQRELKLALDEGKEQPDGQIFLIPVRLDDCQHPEPLADTQSVDLFGQQGWSRLIAAIQAGMSRKGGA